ncbi:hypothetical protein [Eubacterium aggregans]|uniref:hypothetical protein n=1 Tax=Eubacterium aggregans TaxID=81409 RepID=UPI003F2C7D2F
MHYLNIVSHPINEVTDIRMYSEKDIWQMLGKAGFTGAQWKKLNKYTYMAKADASTRIKHLNKKRAVWLSERRQKPSTDSKNG